jgi:LysR family carnitine catabolism transcriptional activator
MNMTLRQVRAFVVVARFSSFTRAADLLHLTQPALNVIKLAGTRPLVVHD